MSSLTNLAQGTALAIISSVFASGTIETKAIVAEHFLTIVDGDNRFAVNRSVILFSAINASPIPAISPVGCENSCHARACHFALIGSGYFCLFLEFIH